VTKTPRTSSYLRYITRHHDSNLPLLKPSRTLTQLWGTMLPQDRATETMLPSQHPSARTGAIPLLQDIVPLSAQRATELQPALSTTKIAQPALGQEATSPSSALPSRLLAPVALPGGSPATEETALTARHQQPQMEMQLAPAKSTRTSSSPATEETAPTARHQQPQREIQLVPAKSTRTSSSPVIEETTSTTSHQQPEMQLTAAKSTRMSSSAATTELVSLVSHQQPQREIQLAPAKSTRSVAAETSRSSPATQVTFDRQTRASGEKKPASVTLRPLSRLQQEVTSTLTNSRRSADFAGQESNASARAHGPQHRSAALPHTQETQQHPAIHIGTIDIHIVSPAPAAPLPPARSTTVRSHSTPALSREMTSFIGLRQG
jgi:hypothetical protein